MKDPQLMRPRVLIVEDEQVVAADLQRSLTDLGYDVLDIVESGRKAIRLAEQQRPDLVLMDILLKGAVDGISAADQIVKRYQIPVVFLTANTNEEVLARAKAIGPYGYLIKPFREKELNATILIALHQHERAQEIFSQHTWLRTVLASLSDAVIAIDCDARVRYMNPVAESLTGWRLSDAEGRPACEIFVITTLSGKSVSKCPLERVLEAGSSVSMDRFLLLNKNGRRIPIENSVAPIEKHGRTIGAASIFLDITDRLKRENEAEEERDRLEEQVQETTEALGQTRAELRALAGHLITSQEEERRRIAQELHDDLGQRTALFEMQLARAQKCLTKDSSELSQLLSSMSEQMVALNNGLRSVSHRLHPSILADLGLVPALRALTEDLRCSGCDVALKLPESVEISSAAATALYRSAQEALRNAMKHAPGAPVRLTLTATAEAVQLMVQDAGPGFDVNQARAAGGLGLLSMHERARIVNGTLLLRTKPGEGTLITVRVPRNPPKVR